VACDEALAQRFRDGLRSIKDITEKRMVGGLCLLVNGNMLGGVDRRAGVVELEHPRDHCGVGVFSKLRESRSEANSGQKSGVFASG
jgi:hypothetical protein